MNRDTVLAWVAGYERAWRGAATEVLAELFTGDAEYLTAPFEEPFIGLEAIMSMWQRGRRSVQEEFVLFADVVALDDTTPGSSATAVVRLQVEYGAPHPQLYRNLWVLSFASDSRCTAFEEWPFWPAGTAGNYLPGPKRLPSR